MDGCLVWYTLLCCIALLYCAAVSLLKIASCFDRVLWFVFFFAKEPLLIRPLLFRGAWVGVLFLESDGVCTLVFFFVLVTLV